MSQLSEDEVGELQKHLSLSLGQVRTEYAPEEDVFDMFSRPVYWGQLLGVRPCFLIGGRGTGKTTTLRSLSYSGQFQLSGRDTSQWVAVGSYWRVESNVVAAFKGKRLADEEWERIFAHYINLQLIKSLLGFLLWRTKVLDKPTHVSADQLRLTCISLHTEEVASVGDLNQAVEVALARLEAAINGRTSALLEMHLSALGKPLEYLLRALKTDSSLSDLVFTFCIDEYENLEPYQQRVMNTLVKHVGDSAYTFKIGMRDTGSRERSTLAANQPLQDPADYTIVDIVSHLKDQSFADFAAAICKRRLQALPPRFQPSGRFEDLLPDLSLEREAELLGVQKRVTALRSELERLGATGEEIRSFDRLEGLSAYLVEYWSKSQGTSPLEVLRDSIERPNEWKVRLGNYAYVMLFTLKQARGVSKYYAGWSTLTQLADGNIRYVLRLLYECLLLHTSDSRDLDESVSWSLQTRAASRVGEKTVRELQGLSPRGGQLTHLVLSFGRIFEVMASNPFGHTPEVNQFRVNRSDLLSAGHELDGLLEEAVAHDCLVAFDGDKKARISGERNTFDYQLHPIFAPYFGFSHRRKRRMTVSGASVIALSSDNASSTIAKLVKSRSGVVPGLPDQLALYSGFFDDHDR